MKLVHWLVVLQGAIGMTGMGHAETTDVLWIDVRTLEEHGQSSIDGHVHIPHEDIEAGIQKLKLDLEQEIKVYCRSGRRSGIAQNALQVMGYKNVENVGSFEEALHQSK